ncbi:CDP-glycerol glycerophosphotransferase family protein [Vibrio owensii]|uniref:CDP-glycerol glycerophosphotransferase family protein n=1 Tax=Vibrio owensii TaxID=696485 RepID=UPI001FD0007F|nr:CDP-glycerol glycerophosphotransferase family protein [Vibrio owensii]
MVSAGNSIFETSLIRRHKIEFETGISDDFADTMFIATYAMETQNHQRCYVQKARHFRNFKYKASLFNQPEWNRPNRYYERLSNGVLPLFRMAEEKYGYIPRFIQNLAIYEMSWIIKKIAKTPMTELPLSEMERTFTQNLLVNICEQIPPQNIHRYNVSGLSQVARLMMLNFAESSWPSTRIVNVHDVDVDNQRLRISFATNSDDNSVLSFNGQGCTVHSTKDVTMKALDYMAATRYQWVSLPSVDENELLITLGKNPALLKYGNIVINNRSENTSQVFAHICAGGISKPIPQSIAYEIQHYQRNGNSKYRDCWLLQDRVDAADDNAEHLYRYICQNHPETNIYFCLSKSSADWPRLEADGFKLVDSESHDHRMCYLHAKHIISSHANPIVTNFLSRQEYGELLRGKFHFIQHGVIAADFSNWLNKKTLHTFVTSSPREYQSIAKSERYAFTDKETILSGLPRHDRLVELSKVHSAKQVLIMPTWRSWLVDKPEGNSPWRKKSGFNETEYFKHWNGVLNSDAIREMYNQGYEIVFNPHPNLRFYIDEFDLPEYVSTPLNSKESMQYLFARAEFMITDYSSVQFEMGLLRKPVFYYQFDKEKVFGGQHTLSKGYFDYDEDGFGPVTYSQYDLELKLYDYLINKDDLVNNTVLPRSLKQMPLNDGKCSERVFNHIKRTEGGL